MAGTAAREEIRPDVILKDFWRDNGRFADLFNAALFGGEERILPEMLTEADTDLSSVLKRNGYAKAFRKSLDLVKRSAEGVTYALLGLENQQRIHYGMPLRHMLGDALGYLKEYTELSRKNRDAKKLEGSEEYLSGLTREDRLHPMVTLCVYYGESEWDGPFCLTDMLDIPEWLEGMVSDYRMNLVQVRRSGDLKFHNSDVSTVFEVSRRIYQKDFRKLEEKYGDREIDSELGLVIGAITESEGLIRQSLAVKGGRMKMCSALEELVQKGVQQGIQQGIVKTCQDFGASQEAAAEKVMRQCGLGEADAWESVRRYWKLEGV